MDRENQAPQPADADVRELSKWLNEEPNRPIDRQALARVLASCQHRPSPAEGDDEARERALFEHAERASDLARDEDCPDDYRNTHVQSAWDGWQKRAALSAQPNVQPKGTVPPARDMDDATTDAAIHYTAGWNACREATLAAAQGPAPAPTEAPANPYAHSKNHASVWQAGFDAGQRRAAPCPAVGGGA